MYLTGVVILGRPSKSEILAHDFRSVLGCVLEVMGTSSLRGVESVGDENHSPSLTLGVSGWSSLSSLEDPVLDDRDWDFLHWIQHDPMVTVR